MPAVAFEPDAPYRGAPLGLPGAAMPAIAAGHIDRRGHAIARTPVRHTVPQLDHLSGELMADDPWQLPQGLATGDEMQVGGTQAAGAHLH
jgi:hypothetical protein